jgi:hypothetical protein
MFENTLRRQNRWEPAEQIARPEKENSPSQNTENRIFTCAFYGRVKGTSEF